MAKLSAGGSVTWATATKTEDVDDFQVERTIALRSDGAVLERHAVRVNGRIESRSGYRIVTRPIKADEAALRGAFGRYAERRGFTLS